jgi:peptidoglycan/LPS O-acetylase OafA/YrhL
MITINSTNRLIAVDCLRAIAALLVVWQHSSEVFFGYLSNPVGYGAVLAEFAHTVDFGRIGVVIFFCISGYVIPSSLVEGRPKALKHFAISRFFRLFPAYWFAVVFGYFGTYYLWNKPFSLGDWLANAVMISEWLGAQPAMGLFWTLQIELIFYIFCAGLFSLNLLHREKTKGLLALVFSLIFLLSLSKSIPLLFKFPDIISNSQYWAAWLSMMFFGAAFRQNRDQFGRTNQLFVRLYLVGWLLFFPLSGLVSWIKMGYFLHPDLVRFYSSHSIGILVFFLGSTIFQLKSHRLAILGRMSYSIYLFHGAIIFSLAWIMLYAIGIQNKINIHLAISMTIVFITTIAFSNFVYKFIELPSINRGKNFR